MPLLLLLFFQLSQAEEFASEKYCFPSQNVAQLAKQKFVGIQVPSDIITQDSDCLTIQMRPHRRELIQRYLTTAIPGTVVSFSSEDVQNHACHLRVEKFKLRNHTELNAQLASPTSINQQTSTQNASETMSIQTIKNFKLSFMQDAIEGSCRYISQDRYEISLSVQKNPRPAANSIVPVQPPNEETMLLQTQLVLNRGERIEVGQIVRNLRSKGHDLNIQPEAKINAETDMGSENVYLSLE